MDATKLLELDHRKVEKLFTRCEELGEDERDQMQEIMQEICEELTIHAQIEESILYPWVQERDAELGGQILEAFEEHRLVKIMIRDLQALESDDERLAAKVKVLKDLVLHHVEEEEGQLFPQLHEKFGKSTLDRLGAELSERKRELKEQLPQLKVTMAREVPDTSAAPRG